MAKVGQNPFTRETITEDVLSEWQKLLDEAAEILGVPAGLITRLDGEEFEVLLSSETEGNPYEAGMASRYPDSGWYCEHTLKKRDLNLIPNAMKDPRWRENDAAVHLNIVSYVGLPIQRPDGEQFGTVCFLDNKENAHNDLHIKLVEQIKRMVELSLRIVHARSEIDRRDRLLNGLSKIYPICSYCKKVREKSGAWVEVETYLDEISGGVASHGVCPQCYERESGLLEKG